MRLRETMAREELIIAPAAYDVVSAQIIERAGYPVCWISGLGHEASDLGCPDLSLTTAVEMVRRAASVVKAVDVPVICDADTGFGGAINLTRTVRLFEAAGVSAIHIEDQTFPKRCGALAGKQVISGEAFAKKIEAAVAARKSSDFMIIARTDAKALGIEEVIARLNSYIEHGADMGMLGDFYSLAEYRKITAAVRAPIVACAADADHRAVQPNFSAGEWRQTDVKAVVYWYLPLFAAMKAVERVVNVLRLQGTTGAVEPDLLSYEEYGRVVKLDRWMNVGKREE